MQIPPWHIDGIGKISHIFSTPDSLVGDVKRRSWSHFTCHWTAPSRACHFQSICWDRVNRTFVYYEEPGQLPLIHSSTGTGFKVKFGLDFVRSTNDASNIGGPGKSPFLPLIRLQGPIPNDHVFAPETVHVYFISHYAGNFGHAIGDDISPAFALQSIFGLLTADVKLLTPRDYAETSGKAGMPGYERARQFLREMTEIVSNHPIGEMHTDQLYRPLRPNTKDKRYTCFRSLRTGHSRIGFSYDRGRYLAPLSGYMIKRAMAKFPSVLKAASMQHSRQRVLLVKKMSGRRAIANVDELANRIRTTFQVRVDVINPAGMHVHEQMARVGFDTHSYSRRRNLLSVCFCESTDTGHFFRTLGTKQAKGGASGRKRAATTSKIHTIIL
jgi:hypothetical protein